MPALDDCISFLLGKAYQQVHAEMRRRLVPLGITPMQCAVLQALWEEDGRTGAEIGERLVLDSATVTGVIDRLERAGLLHRRPDPTDRRRVPLYLTPEGRHLQNHADKVTDEVNAEFFTRYGGDRPGDLRDMLRRALPRT